MNFWNKSKNERTRGEDSFNKIKISMFCRVKIYIIYLRSSGICHLTFVIWHMFDISCRFVIWHPTTGWHWHLSLYVRFTAAIWLKSDISLTAAVKNCLTDGIWHQSAIILTAVIWHLSDIYHLTSIWYLFGIYCLSSIWHQLDSCHLTLILELLSICYCLFDICDLTSDWQLRFDFKFIWYLSTAQTCSLLKAQPSNRQCLQMKWLVKVKISEWYNPFDCIKNNIYI